MPGQKQPLKFIGRILVPKRLRMFLYNLTPKIMKTNTYILKEPKLKVNLVQIESRYLIRVIDINDAEKLDRAYGRRNTFDKSILPRLSSPAWVGLAVVDGTTEEFAYVSWIIKDNIDFIREFKITMKKDQSFLRHGYCVPEHRHKGLHTRMEQERINYCVRKGVREVFIQIVDSNEKGKNSVLSNGFEFYQSNYILRIPVLGIYRELFSALKSPFKRVI